MSKIRVLLVDDHKMMCQMFATYFMQEPDIEVIGVRHDAESGFRLALELQPDVLVMDIGMPGLSCFEVGRQMRDRCPKIRLLFLSGFFHDAYINEALKVEAAGYITKLESLATMVQAIRTVAAGGIYFSPDVQKRILVVGDSARLGKQDLTRGQQLTPRETEVLRHLARGLSKKDVAKTMHISPKTVDRHTASLMAKLEIHNRVELARYAIREGLAEA